jgi:predicted ABC-type ATPase
VTDLYTQGIMEDLDRRESGQTFDIEVDQFGVPRYVGTQEMFQGAEDQTNPFAIAGEVTPTTPAKFAEKTFEVGVGAVGGTVLTAIGTLGDFAGIIKGVADAIGAEEGKGFEAFLTGLSSVSSVIGSERTIKIFEEAVNALPLDEESKQNVLAGSKYFGEVAGLPVGGTALARGAQRIGQKILEPGQAPAMAPQVPSAATADIEAGRPVVAFEETAKDFQKQLESSEIDINALEEHPHVQNTLGDMMSRPTTQQEAGDSWGTPEWEDSRSFTSPQGEQIVGWKPAVKWLHNHARSFAWTDDNLPVPENPVKFDKELIIVMGPPAAGKSTLANPIARSKNASIIDADEAKKLIPGYDDGVGANVVHEESSQINHIVFESAIQTGENIVLPIVGGNANKVISKYIGPAKQQGYRVTLVDMMVDPDEALNRMYGRFVSKSRLIPPDVAKVGRAPSEAFDQLVEKGAADAYTKIDNNPGRGEPRIIVRDDENLIESSGINAQRLDQEGGRSNRGSDSTQVQTNGPRGRGGNDADITVTYSNEAAQ